MFGVNTVNISKYAQMPKHSLDVSVHITQKVLAV